MAISKAGKDLFLQVLIDGPMRANSQELHYGQVIKELMDVGLIDVLGDVTPTVILQLKVDGKELAFLKNICEVNQDIVVADAKKQVKLSRLLAWKNMGILKLCHRNEIAYFTSGCPVLVPKRDVFLKK
jgi:hypothetical protein